MITYRATNNLNGKFYIGSTTDFEKRKKSHLKSREKYPFQNALRNNPDIFEWEVWSDDCDEPVLEQALLDMFYGTEQCYNLNPKANHPPSWKGKKQSEEHIEKRVAPLRGRERSKEHCENISNSKKGINPFPNGIPEEVIAKRSASRIANGKKWTLEQRESLSKKKQLPEQEVKRRTKLIDESGIDLNRYGAISKVAKLLGLTHPAARGFLNKHYKNHDLNNNEPQS